MERSGTRDTLAAMRHRPLRPPPSGGPSAGRGPRRRRAGGVRLALLLVALVVLVGTTVWVAGRYLVTAEVRVPTLTGLTYEQASLRLRDLGLVPQAFAELDPRAAPSEVLSQAPGAGQVVRPGRRVALGVNALAEVRIAPNLVGLREADALSRALAVGTVVQRVVYVSAAESAGVVVRQEPGAGTALAPQQTLLVAVSRGSAAAPFALPDLRGRPVDEAEAALVALGIRHVERIPAALSFDRPLTVTDQRPAPGHEVLPATPITLVYALEGTRVVRVPDLVGLPMWRAQLELRAAQLEVGAVQRVDDPSLPEGVVEARPNGYTVAGSPVALVVNGPTPLPAGGAATDPAGVEGAPPREATPTRVAGLPDAVPAPGTSEVRGDGSRIIPFRFEPASVGVASLMREPYRLQLIVSDAEGERTEFDRLLAAGESLAVPVRVVGDEPLLQTFLNGSFFQAWRP